MPQLLKIAELGDPVLREKSEPLEDSVNSIKNLIEDMKFTVGKVSGVGLAAPQVFELKRLFVLASRPNSRYPDAPRMEPQAIINPVIKSSSDEVVNDWEGCLSIPGIRGFVPRAKSIVVEYLNENGELLQKQFDDFIARVFQHEFDHLEGIVFLDRLDSNKDIITEREYLKLMSK